jgi:geranylgeranyl pyrophosphate synthase
MHASATLEAHVADLRAAVEIALARAFASHEPELTALAGAVDYSLLAPGKRIRPILLCAAAQAAGRDIDAGVAQVAAAFELVHAYSLVHDDLPAMDDDALRRGRATSHIVYGEAVAVLVGDALQARAFGLVAQAEGVSAEARLAVVERIAHAAGWRGMVGGQYLDMVGVGERAERAPEQALRSVHDRKTGALIAAAVASGGVVAGCSDEVVVAFEQFGRELGWLFQLVDDLLDATGSAEQLGKTPGKDARSGKVTALDVYGGEQGLRSVVDAQLATCEQLASVLPDGGGRLGAIAQFVHGRDH